MAVDAHPKEHILLTHTYTHIHAYTPTYTHTNRHTDRNKHTYAHTHAHDGPPLPTSGGGHQGLPLGQPSRLLVVKTREPAAREVPRDLDR